MKVQIIGKITGDPDYKTKFALVQRMLEAKGHDVWNPALLPPGWEYERYMDTCLAKLREQEAICCIAGWEKSPGARREYAQALALGLEIMTATVRETVTRCVELGPIQPMLDLNRPKVLLNKAMEHIELADRLTREAFAIMNDYLTTQAPDGEQHEEAEEAKTDGRGTDVHGRYA